MHRLSPPRTGTDFALGTGAGGSTSARGQDDKHISTVDADGVALAAIQALDKLSREKDKKIDQLRRDLDALRAELEPLQRALAKCARLGRGGREGRAVAGGTGERPHADV